MIPLLKVLYDDITLSQLMMSLIFVKILIKFRYDDITSQLMMSLTCVKISHALENFTFLEDSTDSAGQRSDVHFDYYTVINYSDMKDVNYIYIWTT